MTISSVASFVVTRIDHVGAQPEAREITAYVSSQRGVAISPVAADARHLKYGLNELHVVRLVGMDTGIGSPHGDIDRVEQCVGCIDDASVKETISAVAGLISTTRDRAAAEPAVAVLAAKSRSGYASAYRRIPASAVTADSGDLRHALIDGYGVGLMRIDRGVVAGDRNIDRHVDDDGSVQ